MFAAVRKIGRLNNFFISSSIKLIDKYKLF